ncbi:MAG: hypothetical protein IK152_03635 [Lachnospiraceae bacterium]|nr:hypothetical protein [Lachnospiraceae bacterium]
MNTGDRFALGYNAIKEGRWEGTYSLMEAVAELYLIDAIDDIIYGNLIGYVEAMDVTKPTEADQWLKLFLLDARYGRLMLEPGDLLENIKKALNELDTVHDEYIIQNMLDGSIGKIKYAKGSYYTIQFDREKGLQYLVRITGNEMEPMDFDVDDFRMNRAADRVEFVYTRGNKKVMSVGLDGGDKRELDRTALYPEESE